MGKKADTERLCGHKEKCSWESSGNWRSRIIEKHENKQLSQNFNPSPCEVIDRNTEVTLRKKDGVELKWNVSFVKKYQENGTTESESVVPLQPTASPLEPATPFLPITSQPIASQPIASQPIVSQPIVSQPIASPISMQQIVNPSSPMLKTSQRPTRMIRIPKQVEDYELSKAWWDFVAGRVSYSCTLFIMLWNWTWFLYPVFKASFSFHFGHFIMLWKKTKKTKRRDIVY